MCTISWLLNNNGYEVFFNRDEQHSRPKAEAPSLHRDINVIMPIDPQGKGSWTGSNLQGDTVCLLNNYQAQANMDPQRIYTSRGQLIPEVLQLANLSSIENLLHSLNLDNFMPFILCVFPADLTATNNSPSIYQWDGYQLSRETAEQPIISSSVKIVEVTKSRKTLFDNIMQSGDNRQNHLKYHLSHLPEKGYLSVCMHRDDAQTQSLSHILINDQIHFHYLDGALCENSEWIELVQKKITPVTRKKEPLTAPNLNQSVDRANNAVSD